MKLKQEGRTGTNGLDYYDICTDDFKRQFGYIAKKAAHWKMYVRVDGEKNYFIGSFLECLRKVEELTGIVF